MKQSKKFFSVLLALTMILSVVNCCSFSIIANAEANVWDGSIASSFAGGSGTESNPYIIETGSQLAYMESLVNSNSTYASKCYKLNANIDLNNLNWNPIGVFSVKFCGKFDGNNYTIKNLYSLNPADSSLWCAGLFGMVNGGTIINVNLENVNVENQRTSTFYTAALVAYATGTVTVDNCHVLSGVVNGREASGIVGYIGNTKAAITITNCSNNANINENCTNPWYTGGIVGYVYPVTNYENSTVIENCKNYGNLSVAQRYGGGIVGYASDDIVIRYCENYGNITADPSADSSTTIVGGIVGGFGVSTGVTSSIFGCINVGTVKGVSSKLTGGIVGYNNTKDETRLHNISYCINAGTVNGGDILGSHSKDTESSADSVKYVEINNCIYTGSKLTYFDIGSKGSVNQHIDSEYISSGAAAYFSNKNYGSQIWYQTLGVDAYPTTDSTHGVVYSDSDCIDNATFSNTPVEITKHHSMIKIDEDPAKCGIGGYGEYYQCENCGWIFGDIAGTIQKEKNDFYIEPTDVGHIYDENGFCTVCNYNQIPEKNDEGFYEVYNLGELEWIVDPLYSDEGTWVSAYKEPTEKNYNIKLMADIDMSVKYNAETGKSWKPIGGETNWYCSEFDGNGHKITGLYINDTTIKQRAGFFGTVYAAISSVHDLTLEDVYINAPNATYVGGVSAYASQYSAAGPNFSNCEVSGTIIGKTNVGGILGYSQRAVRITNCKSNASVTCLNASGYAGGIIGSAYFAHKSSAAEEDNILVTENIFTGTVSGGTNGDIAGYVSTKANITYNKYVGEKVVGINADEEGTYVHDNIRLALQLGDVDLSGEINSNDYAMLVAYVQCDVSLTDEQKAVSDFNGDTAIDAFDVIWLDLYLNNVINIDGTSTDYLK